MPENFQTLKLAVRTLSKTFLQFLRLLQTLPNFSVIWLDMLSVLEVCSLETCTINIAIEDLCEHFETNSIVL